MLTDSEHAELLNEMADHAGRHANLARDYATFLREWAEVVGAADALADAVKAFMNWRDPFDYEGVANAEEAVSITLKAYREARR